MLLSLERILETPIVHCFDWIAGTSTGGMLALALASGKAPIECLYLYFKLKDKVRLTSDSLINVEIPRIKLATVKY